MRLKRIVASPSEGYRANFGADGALGSTGEDNRAVWNGVMGRVETA